MHSAGDIHGRIMCVMMHLGYFTESCHCLLGSIWGEWGVSPFPVFTVGIGKYVSLWPGLWPKKREMNIADLLDYGPIVSLLILINQI